MSDNLENMEQYAKDIGEMFDEAKPLMDGFQSLFPDDPIGHLKYLFTLHCMVMQACEANDIPRDVFADFIPALVAVWHVRGKPSDYDFKVLPPSPPPNGEGKPN